MPQADNLRDRHASLAMTKTSHSEAETMRIAARFARSLRGGEVVLLEGELGAGKTTFVRGMARAFGIREPIRSPTFTLMHIHRIANRKSQIANRTIGAVRRAIRYFVHVDAYRLRGPAELRRIGIEEYAGKRDTIVVIEWGRKARLLLRRHHPLHVKLTYGESNHERLISL